MIGTNSGEAMAELACDNPSENVGARSLPASLSLSAHSCPTCSANNSAGGGTVAPSYVYALGRIVPRFPTIAVERELAQVLGRMDVKGLTDPQALHKALSERRNRYLLRKLCWVLTIEGLETYILLPRDPADFDLLVESLRPKPNPADHDLVIGVKGPSAPPEMCNGLMVPIVAFDQIYSFDRDSLIAAIPKSDQVGAEKLLPAAEEIFDRIMQIADNAGASDEHRALNYLAVRYHRIYEAAAEAFGRNESLSAVDVYHSPLSALRKIVDVVFSFTNRGTDVLSKQSIRVDVTEEFPFLVTKLTPYFNH